MKEIAMRLGIAVLGFLIGCLLMCAARWVYEICQLAGFIAGGTP